MENSEMIEKLADYRSNVVKREKYEDSLREENSPIRDIAFYLLPLNTLLYVSLAMTLIFETLFNLSLVRVASIFLLPNYILLWYFSIRSQYLIKRKNQASLDDGFIVFFGSLFVYSFLPLIDGLDVGTMFQIIGIMILYWSLQFFFLKSPRFSASGKSDVTIQLTRSQLVLQKMYIPIYMASAAIALLMLPLLT